MPFWHHHGGEHGGGVSTFTLRLSPLTLRPDTFLLLRKHIELTRTLFKNAQTSSRCYRVPQPQVDIQGPHRRSRWASSLDYEDNGTGAVDNSWLLESQHIVTYDWSHISAGADGIFGKLMRVTRVNLWDLETRFVTRLWKRLLQERLTSRWDEFSRCSVSVFISGTPNFTFNL